LFMHKVKAKHDKASNARGSGFHSHY